MVDDPPPLSEGNRFQRAYARWAEPLYARLPAQARDEARAIDRYLYSRRGLWVWAAMVGAAALIAVILVAVGLQPMLATAIALLAAFWLPSTMLGLWMRPSVVLQHRWAVRVALLTAAGALVGFITGHVGRHGGFHADLFLPSLARGAGPLILAVALTVAALLGSGWLAAELRRRHDTRRLERLALVAERDAAARDAAEARLRRLQAQIQPHFLFNTLSTLQHWVDTRDPRAGPLLRELTGFLRRSTELLGGEEVRLADEVAAVGHYLAIQHARLGERLAFDLDVDPALADRRLPPGLLLSWVENALEHAIEPALDGGRVCLRAGHGDAGWWVEVADDGLGLAPDWREGVGLGNARQRIAHAFGGRARLAVGPAEGGAGTRVRLDVTDAVAPAPRPAEAAASAARVTDPPDPRDARAPATVPRPPAATAPR
jgi:hypothetical protein